MAFKSVVLQVKDDHGTVAVHAFDYDDAFAVGQTMKREMDQGFRVICFGSNDIIESFDRRSDSRVRLING